MEEKNRNDNIFIDQPSGELTFGKIFKVLKCSLLRMLVYVIIACIIAGSISIVLVATSTTNKTVSTIIEYNYNGINAGLDPFGDKFSVDKIKDVDVLNKAISSASLDDKEKVNATSLASHIKIKEVIPSNILAHIEDLKSQANKKPSINEELNNIKYYPTRFVIYLDGYDGLEISEKEALVLLSSVVDAYREKWDTTYVTSPALATGLFKDLSEGKIDKEYLHYETLLDYQINTFRTFLEKNLNINYVYEGSTYASLLGDLKAIITTDYSLCNSFITQNKAIKNSATVVSSLNNELKNMQFTIETLNAQIDSMTEQVKNFTPNSIIIPGEDGKNQIQNSYPPEYWALQNKTSRAILERSTLEIGKKKLEEKVNSLGSNPIPNEEINATADTLLKDLGTSLNNLAIKAQKLTESYKENVSLCDSVYAVVPAAPSTERSISNTLIVAIFLIALVIAIIAAISVTVKLQRSFAFKKKASEAVVVDSNTVDTTVKEDEKKQDDKE